MATTSTSSSSLAGSVALITGGSRGIGRACAVAFAREGCNVAVVARTESGLRETAAQCVAAAPGCKVAVIVADVTKVDQLSNAVKRCVDELGGINILMCNAGIYASDIESVFQSDAMAAFRITEMAVPHIKKEAATKKSAILFTASMASRMAFKGGAAYCASKHAILGFAGCTYEDLREEGIKVCAILPGFVNTPMINWHENLVHEKLIQPEDVASVAVFVAKSSPTACPTEITLRPQRTPYRTPTMSVAQVVHDKVVHDSTSTPSSAGGAAGGAGTTPKQPPSKRQAL